MGFVQVENLPIRKKCGFEFHLSIGNYDLRITPSAFSGIGRPVIYFITCNTVLTRPNKVETAIQGCNSWLSVWILTCRSPVKLFT